MGKNAYLAKREAENTFWANTAENITRQLMVDTLEVVLHEKPWPRWGYKQIKRLVERWGEVYNYFYDTLDLKDPECDYKREELDRILRDIVKDHQPFEDYEKRYPEIKRVTYEGRRKR